MKAKIKTKREFMKALTVTLLFLSFLLGFTACTGLPAEPANPAVLEVKVTQTQTLPPPAKVATTEMPRPTATASQTETETPSLTPTPISKPVFKTSIGDLVIEAVEWTDQVNGVAPGPDERLMLITLGKPGEARLDRNNFSLQTFDRALRDQSNGEVHLSGDDGSYAVCSMAGWVKKETEVFAFGFRVPKTAKTVQLFWPGNEPIDLHPNE